MFPLSWESVVANSRAGYFVCYPGPLSRHFLRKHVSKLQGTYIDCQICNVRLEDRLKLLIHAERVHGTVSG
ncbi:hypothetical protein B0O99DRAFT_706350, partial [Bisporella sp. PMI_857]